MTIKELQINENYRFRLSMKKDGSMPVDLVYKNQVVVYYAKNFYKFYPLNLNSIDALANNYFWMSSPNNFNDPFDFNISLINGTDTTIKDYSEVGVCCFSKEVNESLMWGHYANGLNGFALKLKSLHGEQIQSPIGSKIIYCGSVVYLTKLVKRNDVDALFSKLYLSIVKDKKWKYEKELRLVCSGLKDPNRKFTYNPKIIEAIYVGHKVFKSLSTERSLMLRVILDKYANIPIYCAFPCSTSLKIKFEKIDNETLMKFAGRLF